MPLWEGGVVHFKNNNDDVVNGDDYHNYDNYNANVDVFLTQQPPLWLDAFLAKNDKEETKRTRTSEMCCQCW